MSRIGQKPVVIPAGVTVTVEDGRVAVKGAKGALQYALPKGIRAEVDGAVVVLRRPDDSQGAKALHGLSRTLVANMVEGVTRGFRKELQIEGVGFRAAKQGTSLTLALGFSAPVVFPIPAGVEVAVNNQTEVAISGADKQCVGDFAARVRSAYPAEPYKGKGLRYKGERVRRKEGKTVA